MKYSLPSLTPFLRLFCNCQFRRLDSIQFLCSQAHIPAGWRLETRLTLLNWTLLYNNFVRTTQKTQPPYCLEDVFTAPLHSSGSYSIVICVFVAAEICLLSHCPAMNIYSDFTIPAFGRHVTILLIQLIQMASLFKHFIYLMLGSVSRKIHFKRQNEVTYVAPLFH
jgi:hypothetical protein